MGHAKVKDEQFRVIENVVRGRESRHVRKHTNRCSISLPAYQHRHGAFFTDSSDPSNDVNLSVCSADWARCAAVQRFTGAGKARGNARRKLLSNTIDTTDLPRTATPRLPIPQNTGATHVDNTLKNNVQLTWTAPPKGTGEVVFSYAVVTQNNGSINTFYATLTSPTIAELDSHGVSCAGGVACFGHNCSGSYSTCVDGYCRCPDNPDRDYCTCLDWPVTWRLNVTAGVTIDRVLLTSSSLAASSVTYPQCSVRAVEKISDKNLPGSYGSDDGGGDSVGLLKYLTQRSESCVSDSVCNDGKERECSLGEYCSGSNAIGTMCIDGSCRCPNDPNRDYCTCLARHAGCNISLDPDHAPGIPYYLGIQESVYSCSNNNSNSSYAVHILGSYDNGRKTANSSVSISGYNFGIKPIILVLVSYKALNWILNIPPGIVIHKVLLTSDNYYRGVSNVTYPSGSVTSVERDSHLQYAYGNDEGGSNTIALLQYVTQRFGPVSSFSGSRSANNWKLDLGSTLPSPAVCPSVSTTPVPATNISVCPKVKSSLVTVTSVKRTMTSVMRIPEATMTSVAGSISSIFVALGGAVGFCIVSGTLSVMSVITAAAIKQRKTRAQGNNSNSTINNELTYIPHVGNNLVTSTGFGVPFSKNTTAAADRLPPCNSEVCYSPLVEQFTADKPPPVYPASGHASV
eukprot:Em0009g90a